MRICWADETWDDHISWQAQDRRTLTSVNSLIRDIARNGNEGLGKPEALDTTFPAPGPGVSLRSIDWSIGSPTPRSRLPHAGTTTAAEDPRSKFNSPGCAALNSDFATT